MISGKQRQIHKKNKRLFSFFAVFLPFLITYHLPLSVAFLLGCRSSYPKEKLNQSVQELFQKELGVHVLSKLAGRTLYVSFEIEKLVTKDLELPKEATGKLENAMVSISRIALSTDAEIHYTVIQARDPSWGVQTTLIRRMQDLKDLFYWRISKTDFDERLVLEIQKNGETVEPPADEWSDITLPEFMGRSVASRINLGARSNPFLNVLLGIEKITSRYDPVQKTVHFVIEGYSNFTDTASVTSDLLRNSIKEQMALMEKKYPPSLMRKEAGDPLWAKVIRVEDLNGIVLFQMDRKEWESIGNERTVN